MTIVLIVTKTFGGIICERMLRYIFEEKIRANVKVLYIEMSVSNSKDLKHQAAGVLRVLADALTEGEPATTCFAPIGGYKVITSLGYLIGSFLHYPTAYLHEDHQILIELPPMPLDIDEDFVGENSQLLRKCQLDLMELGSLTYEEQQLIQKHTALFSLEEHFVALSPFGEFLFERSKYDHLFGTKYILSEQVQRFAIENKHQSIFIAQQLRELIKKLKYENSLNNDLMHEKEFEKIDPKKVLYHLYKGASNGQTAFRLAYQYDQATDVLTANHLWLDHDKYMREAAIGIGIYKVGRKFVDETEKILIRG
ncbi:CRISPR-associated protein [Bacillus sp. DTU_2020_1000418_1_SI_GHA_SEK_038]|uniref:CRISPR-associated protein n=1 Tax=Bacillus sp. DTU_2020_1000418_1_SI_GHA_SEK_038 TaxID=3077585 RepID=UPI0028E57590|nr:CRISPR-associated protein [Bacillus sp. DTU_2020_1000418_1_SI_GHA_SEK_038]WNS77432.1 CRISPR-associated protein [Bacillus sp. DTU_2020_1000418_1_SI_GHA_SEK_038]